MKKLITLVTVLALTVGGVGMTVSAHGHHSSGHHSTTANTKTKIVYHCQNDCTYTDKDGDGICDNCDSKGYYCKNNCVYVDKDGDGICDNCDTKGVCSYKTKAKKTGCCHK